MTTTDSATAVFAGLAAALEANTSAFNRLLAARMLGAEQDADEAYEGMMTGLPGAGRGHALPTGLR